MQSGCIRKIGACRPTYPIKIDLTNEGGIEGTSLSILRGHAFLSKRDEEMGSCLSIRAGLHVSRRRIIHRVYQSFIPGGRKRIEDGADPRG